MATKKETKTTKESPEEQEQKRKEVALEVRIDRLIERENTNIKAVASITIQGFSVHGIKIMDSKNGVFIAMPSTSYTDRTGEVQYQDIFHPITKESREELLEKVKSAYEKAVQEAQNKEQDEEAEETEEEGHLVGPVQ